MKRNLLVIGFDWNGLARQNPAMLMRKLARDHLVSDETNIMLWAFAPTAGEVALSSNIRVVNRRARFRHLRPLYDLLAPLLIVIDLKRTHFIPQVVVLYDFPFLLAARRVKRHFDAKIVLYLTNLPADLAKTRRASGLKAAYHRFFERQARYLLDAGVAINETTRAYLRAVMIPEERIVTLSPDTITPDQVFIREAKKGFVRMHLSLSNETRILFSVGRLEPEKGFDRVIRAIAALPRTDVVLVIAGEGRMQKSLESLARQLRISDRVYFVGNLSREEIWNYYADADAFILLSLSEALGLVVWEAMYMKVPVIVSGAGGLTESVGQNGDRGFLWNEKCGIADLSHKLEHCFDRDVISPMLERAKRYSESRQSVTDFSSVVSFAAS